jgi:hypothetical protein
MRLPICNVEGNAKRGCPEESKGYDQLAEAWALFKLRNCYEKRKPAGVFYKSSRFKRSR